jgi:signal transduction histidine kinase
MLANISRNTGEITNIINELLTLSEEASHQLYDCTETVDVGGLCSEVMAAAAAHNPRQLSLRLTNRLPAGATLKSNRRALLIILEQLMKNALKFTEQGQIELTVGERTANGGTNSGTNSSANGSTESSVNSAAGGSTGGAADGSTNGGIEFAVADTGIGIGRENHEKVFESFFKVDAFKQGMGLGLTMARKTAERLGGTLTLDAAYTEGARFVLVLPGQLGNGQEEELR